jgi:hypothetical protein
LGGGFGTLGTDFVVYWALFLRCLSWGPTFDHEGMVHFTYKILIFGFAGALKQAESERLRSTRGDREAVDPETI